RRFSQQLPLLPLAHARVSQMQLLLACRSSILRIKRGQRLTIAVRRLCLRCSIDFIDCEALGTMSIEDESPGQRITRICLPWPQSPALTRHTKNDWVIAGPIVDVHIDPIC